jgi:hypothetical protein
MSPLYVWIYYRENNMLERHVSKCRHIIGPVKRFDQKNEMYKGRGGTSLLNSWGIHYMG